jgi:hypothetical protein
MAELLRVESVSAGYGEARVIQGLSFALEDGRSLALPSAAAAFPALAEAPNFTWHE